MSDSYFLSFLNSALNDTQYGFVNASGKAVMVEYSSPNTNKPLHLGHIRNNLLGYSVAEILKASGKKVYKLKLLTIEGYIFVKVCWLGNYMEMVKRQNLRGLRVIN